MNDIIKEIKILETIKDNIDCEETIKIKTLEKAIEALENQKTGHSIYIGDSWIAGLKIKEEAEDVIKNHLKPFDWIDKYFVNNNMTEKEFEQIKAKMCELKGE